MSEGKKEGKKERTGGSPGAGTRDHFRSKSRARGHSGFVAEVVRWMVGGCHRVPEVTGVLKYAKLYSEVVHTFTEVSASQPLPDVVHRDARVTCVPLRVRDAETVEGYRIPRCPRILIVSTT
ncbi:uncharacterized protein LOC107265416 isoform X2 [Cephus cinctus]|uniref:Uncharacterized protein LOC107265416 isoform X2 n=1 Tax=Cephus cinctus TaxID=211228 RepID=A0AAJ7FG96_CEPCN|nr:uncharacterized protein LOC107265416 isoform X2 [Cephus cinctus]